MSKRKSSQTDIGSFFAKDSKHKVVEQIPVVPETEGESSKIVTATDLQVGNIEDDGDHNADNNQPSVSQHRDIPVFLQESGSTGFNF